MDDQIISQTDIERHDLVAPEPAPLVTSRDRSEFPIQLEQLRSRRGWSKADLAKRAGLDPSSITRFEQGSRHPDRETVMLLAETMALPLVDRDRLLASAGYRSELWDDPLLVDLSILLTDPDTPEAIRQDVRSILKAALAYGKLSHLDTR